MNKVEVTQPHQWDTQQTSSLAQSNNRAYRVESLSSSKSVSHKIRITPSTPRTSCRLGTSHRMSRLLTTNKDLRPGRYNGPRIAADAVARYYPRDRNQKKVIDIAAGTGFVAENLKAHGFMHVDALEPSTNMIARAKEKGLYQKIYENLLGQDPLPIAADTYDCAVICGGFGEGHIPCCGLYELLRITKPGGVICNVMREEYLNEVEEYRECLEPMMNSLERAGRWTLVSRDVVPDYFIDLPGIVFMYNVN